MPCYKRKMNSKNGPSAKTIKLDSVPIAPGQFNLSKDHSRASDLINNLNDHCLSHIFKYLTLEDRFTIQTVCQRWRENSHLAWGDMKALDLTQIDLSSSGDKITDEDITMMFEGCGRSLHQLKIGPGDKSTLLPLIGEYCGQLRKLEIKFFHNDKLCSKLVKSTEVKRNCRDFMDNFFIALPHETLTELHFSVYPPHKFLCSSISHAAMNVFDKLTKLSALTLNNYFLIPSLMMAINQKLNLRFLSLEDCKAKRGLPHLNLLVNLEHLNMSQVREVDDDFVIQVSETCKNLKHLDLSNCNNVSDHGISALVELPQLVELVLNYISMVTDVPLSRLHNLRSLKCVGCKSVLDHGMTILLKSAHNLEYLYVLHSGVTPRLLRAATDIIRRRTNGVTLQIFVDYLSKIVWDEEPWDCPHLLIINCS